MPTFFANPAEWEKWLEQHGAGAQELLVGFYKRGSGQPSITWSESVDVALCFGWIDGVRRRIDDVSYTIRFTPRKPRSIWSAVNIQRVEDLSSQGRMRPQGIKAFQVREEARSKIYSFEQQEIQFLPAHEKLFQANKTAWTFFETQAPWYRRAAIWWVISAKREETRSKRLATLIKDSEQGRKLAHLDRHIFSKKRV